MKKFLFLTLIALGSMMVACSKDEPNDPSEPYEPNEPGPIAVTVMGEEVENGSTIDSYCAKTEDLGGGFVITVLDPEIKAMSVKDGEFEITVTNNLSTFADPTIPVVLFCWPSECYNVEPGKSVTQTGSLMANEYSGLSIDTTNWMEERDAFSIPVTVNIVEKGNPSNSFMFNINMIYDPSK